MIWYYNIVLIVELTLQITQAATHKERQIYEEKNFEKSSIVDYDTLAAQDCQNDYDMLKDRPIRKEKVLYVQKSDDRFHSQAEKMQVPGYPGYYEKTKREVQTSFKRRNGRSSIRKRHDSPIIKETPVYQLSSLSQPPEAEATLTPYIGDGGYDKTSVVFRRQAGIDEVQLCELETAYVRRFNRFPYFVKTVSCQKNKLIMTQVMCKPRYEIGHILRLEKNECYSNNQNVKWIHDWETRIVGCDAVLSTRT